MSLSIGSGFEMPGMYSKKNASPEEYAKQYADTHNMDESKAAKQIISRLQEVANSGGANGAQGLKGAQAEQEQANQGSLFNTSNEAKNKDLKLLPEEQGLNLLA